MELQSAPSETSDSSDTPSNPTVVGIGASAGGLAALKEFFSHVPERSGFAYVVVVHLSPDHESHLADLLQPQVHIPVQQVREITKLEADHVYVIPPGRNLSTIDTHLRLTPLEERRRERAPIDHFLRTLSQTHDSHAIAIILTGTGSDGTLGIKDVKERGGFIIVQDPNEAEYDGMPQSAIATGLADLILPLDEMPQRIIELAAVRPRISESDEAAHEEMDESRLLHKIFAQILSRTGRDFSRYKRSTIMRRIRRRMQLARVEELSRYLERLREDSEEIRALADDFLITVTNFFRDEAVFEYLQSDIIPRLFEGKGSSDTVRVWSVGCATGEEAYSLAMVLIEEAERRGGPSPQIQVFASDLHERSLKTARDGLYSGDITTDVSEERIRRFFHKEDGSYRVRKEVRELVVFAPHNLLGDPPFSRIDLISCRNLIIYLQRDVQSDVMEVFHYALCPNAYLILGSSETIESKELFRVENKEFGIFEKRDIPAPMQHLPVFPILRSSTLTIPEDGKRVMEPPAYGSIHQRVVEQFAPPSLLLGPDAKVVHFSEHAGRYLLHPGGEPTTNIFKIIRPEFRVDLRAALHRAVEHGRSTTTKPLPVSIDGEDRAVVLHVRPALEPRQAEFVLVIFDERETASEHDMAAAQPPASGRVDGNGSNPRLVELETELDLTNRRLQGIIEEYESSQEEMKASNEELQSANEELRSTMEELETSKEELQSINEELQTVNQENRHKVEELAQLSSDLENLMIATDIATLFLDRDLRILRFTPQVGKIFNVRATDRGRPLSDLTHRLGYDALRKDAESVLRRLVPIESEAQDEEGRWYLVRILPYRSTTDHIEGVVITLIDISSRRSAELAVRESEERFRALVEASAQMVWSTDATGAMVEESPSWRRFTGQRFDEAEGTGWLNALHPDDRERARSAWQTSIKEGVPFADEFRIRRADDGGYHWTTMRAVPRRTQEGSIRGWVGMNTDINEQRSVEQAFRESEEQYRLLMRSVEEYAIFIMDQQGIITRWNAGAERIFGYAEAAAVGLNAAAIFTEEDRQKNVPMLELTHAAENGQSADERLHLRKDGSKFWGSGVMTALRNSDGSLRGFAKVLRDNTRRKETEDQLHDLNEHLEQRVTERTREVTAQREQLRGLAARLTMAEQEERHRISQILHDDLQQMLYAVQLKMAHVRKVSETADGEARTAAWKEVDSWISDAIGITRRLTVDLSPPVLKGEGLTDTLLWLVWQMEELHNLKIELRAAHAFRIPSEAMRVLLFQSIRELLFNVAKHADTEAAAIELKDADGNLVIVVTDHGCGFEMEALDLDRSVSGHFGLSNVRERLRLFGGEFEIDSHPGDGTSVTLMVPLASDLAA